MILTNILRNIVIKYSGSKELVQPELTKYKKSLEVYYCSEKTVKLLNYIIPNDEYKVVFGNNIIFHNNNMLYAYISEYLHGYEKLIEVLKKYDPNNIDLHIMNNNITNNTYDILKLDLKYDQKKLSKNKIRIYLKDIYIKYSYHSRKEKLTKLKNPTQIPYIELEIYHNKIYNVYLPVRHKNSDMCNNYCKKHYYEKDYNLINVENIIKSIQTEYIYSIY